MAPAPLPRWFSKKEGDGQIERELFPSFSGGTNWKLVIVTGSESGAGTDADVIVELMGEGGGRLLFGLGPWGGKWALGLLS